MSLLALPNELLLHIATFLPSHPLSSLLLSSRRLHALLTFALYRRCLRDNGYGALEFAARTNNIPLATNLLTNYYVPADVVSPTSGLSLTALHTACHHGHVDIARYLLSAGANIEATTVSFTQESPRGVVIPRESPDRTEAYFSARPIHFCSESQSIPLLELLHEHGACLTSEFDTFSPLSDFWEFNATQQAIHNASVLGYSEFVGKLIELGVPVGAGDENDDTPLHYAVFGRGRYDTDEVARILLQKGADVRGENRDGITAVGGAACYGAEVILAMMLEGTNDPDATTLPGRQITREMLTLILEEAANSFVSWGHDNEVRKRIAVCIRMLLGYGADLEEAALQERMYGNGEVACLLEGMLIQRGSAD